MSRVHVVTFCNLIGTARARRRKSTTFPADVTRLSPPPSFLRREPGDEAKVSQASCNRQTDRHTDRQTDKRSTVTLAAHARRGLKQHTPVLVRK